LSKVNDTITATVRVVTGEGFGDADGGRSSLNNGTAADENPTLQVSQANFTANVAGATVIAGKQGLTTPWTVAIDSDGGEQTGTGVLALVPAGPVTVAAAYFNQTNLDNVSPSVLAGGSLDGAANLATLGLLGQAGPVALNAWYLDMEDTFDTFTVGAKASFDVVTAELKYVDVDLDNSDVDNNAIIAKISAKVGPVGLGLNYGKTDKDGGLTALTSTASTTLLGWTVNMHDKADADMFMLNANMDVMPELNIALNYNTVDYANDSEETEIFTQITHKMSKNFSTYVRLGQYDAEENNEDTSDSFRGRLQVEYKF